MEEFPGNSRRPVGPIDKNVPKVEERVKLSKVIAGQAVKRKKPLGRRFMDTFFAKDSGGVIGYLAKEVLIPALQNLVMDMFSQGIEKAVYGEVRTPPGRSGYRGSAMPRPHVSYDRAISPMGRPPVAYSAAPMRRPITQASAMDIGEVVLDTLVDAQNVAANLQSQIEQYGSASVADLNDLMGKTSPYTDNKYGWIDLRQMTIRRVRDGYLLILPDPEDLDYR